MTASVDAILAQIEHLEQQLESEFALQQAGLGFGPERGRLAFEHEVKRQHMATRIPLADYLLKARPLVVLVSPLIYSLIVPFLLIDLWVSLYQAACFRVYDIPRVRRRDYLVFDRAGLPYLNALEKLNCAYCSYVNGVIGYVREVGARTEQYWCPIKHARRVLGAHPRYAGFETYGDGARYREKLREARTVLRAAPSRGNDAS